MRDKGSVAAAALILVALACTVLYATAQDNPPRPNTAEQPSGNASPGEPTVTVLDRQDAEGILGREVRGSSGENMGRIVDVIVDRSGQARAAIIDFGGFLGVGSRKIAVDWKALSFPPATQKIDRVTLELSKDQVRAAPEYKPDKPIVVLGPSGSLELLPLLP